MSDIGIKRSAFGPRRETRVLVLSLPNAKARRDAFCDQAKTTLDWRFFDASIELNPALRYDPVTALRQGGRLLSQAELGCYSSHFQIWRALLADDAADRYLVLEDDVKVDWPFIERLADADRTEVPWPLLRLWFSLPVPTRKVFGPLFGTYQVVELLDHGFSTVAYAIDKAAAARLVAALTEVVVPVDFAMEQGWRHGVRNLAVFPFPVLHPIGSSQIGGERWNDAPKPIAMRIERGVRRVTEALRRRLWHWRGGAH